MKWRADPPIEDPIPVTRERVVAWIAAIAASTVAVVTTLGTDGISLSGDLRHVVVAVLTSACLSLGRGVYESTLVRLDATQIRRASRYQLMTDVVLCALAGVYCAALAVTGDPWSWLGCTLFLTTALDQTLVVRQHRLSRAAGARHG